MGDRPVKAQPSARLGGAVSIGDLRQLARRRLPRAVFDFIDGGAGDEVTLRDNVAAWQRLALRPRVVVDCTDRDPSTTVLGRRHPHPLIVAPTHTQLVPLTRATLNRHR